MSATITTGTTTVITRENEEPSTITHERRPSWRLRVDNGSSKVSFIAEKFIKMGLHVRTVVGRLKNDLN